LILTLESRFFSGNITAIKIFSVALFIIVFLIFLGSSIWSILKKIPQIEVDVKVSESTKQSIKKKIKEDLKLYNKSEVVDQKSNSKDSEKNLLKMILKQKIDEKLKEKENKNKEKKVLNINFPDDKPTFNLNLLSDPESFKTIDENFLIEKAKSIEEKLAEFNLPVTVE